MSFYPYNFIRLLILSKIYKEQGFIKNRMIYSSTDRNVMY